MKLCEQVQKLRKQVKILNEHTALLIDTIILVLEHVGYKNDKWLTEMHSKLMEAINEYIPSGH